MRLKRIRLREVPEPELPPGGATDPPLPDALRPDAERLRWLPRAALLACLACAGSVGLLTAQHWLGVQHFRPLPFVVLLALTFVASAFAVLVALVNPLRWRVVGVSPWWVAVALLPLGLWVAVGVHGIRNWSVRYVPTDPLMNLAKRAGASLMEGEAAWMYPRRLEGRRVVMFHRGISRPDEDVALMDAYLGGLEELLGRPLRAPIHWVRGPVFGSMDGLSIYGLAIGSSTSEMDPPGGGSAGARRLDQLDRHEAAHAVLSSVMPPSADVPTILNEGWAEACGSRWLGTDRVHLENVWSDYRIQMSPDFAGGRMPGLPELFGPDWYHQDSGPVYAYGSYLVRHLVDRHGPEAFLDLAASIRPGNVEATFQRIYGMDVAGIERAIRDEMAAIGPLELPEGPGVAP